MKTTVAQLSNTNRRLSFFEVSSLLPLEVVSQILQAWMAPQHLIVQDISAGFFDEDAVYQMMVMWACDTDSVAKTAAAFPTELQEEYWRIRQLSWLKSAKTFTSGHDFYMSHFALSLDPHSKFPAFSVDNVPVGILSAPQAHEAKIQPLIASPHAHLNFHGLERISLEFTAAEYFCLFDVRVPPFDIKDTDFFGDDLYHDELLNGAAGLLQHTQELTLVFGDRYKWAQIRATHLHATVPASANLAASSTGFSCMRGRADGCSTFQPSDSRAISRSGSSRNGTPFLRASENIMPRSATRRPISLRSMIPTPRALSV
tara:strand:- start:879 stop:1823 length:945 start_codon:yes stop_codon:yes gene_type:complete